MDEQARVQSLWALEQQTIEQGFSPIAGVDEAGRGPLVGPVCVAAVILPFGLHLEGINDSKKLTEKKREALYEQIICQAQAYSVVMVSHEEIDRLNILNATFAGMCRAVDALSIPPGFVLVDGNAAKGITRPHQCVVKGDSKSISIAAASILAKVSRDRFMMELDERYPQYGFAKHKGYPTKAHYEALRAYGATPYHRKTFNLKLEG